MKAIMMSIKPKWVAKILNGEKTIEVRKRFPSDYVGWVYIYCTKGTPHLVSANKVGGGKCFYDSHINDEVCDFHINGKVVAKFTLNKVEEIKYQRVFEQNPFHYLKEESGYGTKTLSAKEFKDQSCLTDKELEKYLNTDEPNAKGYAWHISNLEIFDKPRELSEFYKIGHYEDLDDYFTDEKQINGKWCIPLKKVPQSYCFIETGE